MGTVMNEGERPADASEGSAESDIRSLLDRVAAAMAEIEQAKSERSNEKVRAARTQLAAFHGVARLRRAAERQTSAA
jgi:hypothetical protein